MRECCCPPTLIHTGHGQGGSPPSSLSTGGVLVTSMLVQPPLADPLEHLWLCLPVSTSHPGFWLCVCPASSLCGIELHNRNGTLSSQPLSLQLSASDAVWLPPSCLAEVGEYRGAEARRLRVRPQVAAAQEAAGQWRPPSCSNCDLHAVHAQPSAGAPVARASAPSPTCAPALMGRWAPAAG